jgi:tetratricopeptide (TPR) repeat protein
MSVTSLRNEQSNAAAGVQSKPNSSIQTANVKEKGMDDNFYNNLGKQLTAKGDIPSARQAFKKAISLNPYNVDAYYGLACLSDPAQCRLIMREISEKYKGLIKGGRLSDEQNANLSHLCGTIVGKEMYPETEDLCKEMLARNVMCKDAYLTLAKSYIEQNRYVEAEYAYKQVIELDDHESRAFDGLAVAYHETGRFNLRDQYLRKANELRLCYLPMVTIRNYKKIKNILDAKKIKLVCVQYPMRSIEPLKEVFKEEKDIIFVDNEQVFKKAVAQGYYKDFFRDFFAGDFGHCTDKGNKLLAENIADAIVKAVFHK